MKKLDKRTLEIIDCFLNKEGILGWKNSTDTQYLSKIARKEWGIVRDFYLASTEILNEHQPK